MKKAILLILVLALTVCAVACAKKNDGASTEGGTTATGFGVTVNGTAVELGKDAAPVLAALGTPTLSQEVFDCGEGNSRMFYRFGKSALQAGKPRRIGGGRNFCIFPCAYQQKLREPHALSPALRADAVHAIVPVAAAHQAQAVFAEARSML